MESQIETTNLDSLPINNNVQLNTTEKPPSVVQSSNPTVSANINNELISGLQKAVSSGNTVLPTRDIPIDTLNMTQDQEIKPNYIAESEIKDYILAQDNQITDKSHNKDISTNNNKWESLYEEASLPILIALLFFIFQLPSIQKYFLHLLPFAYTKAGNIKFFGRLIQAFVFAGLIFISSKILVYIES